MGVGVVVVGGERVGLGVGCGVGGCGRGLCGGGGETDGEEAEAGGGERGVEGGGQVGVPGGLLGDSQRLGLRGALDKNLSAFNPVLLSNLVGDDSLLWRRCTPRLWSRSARSGRYSGGDRGSW